MPKFSNSVCSSSNSLWSPATIDTNPIASTAMCLDSRTWNQAAVAAAAANTSTNCYQNYSSYYSNMDYIGPSVQHHTVSFLTFWRAPNRPIDCVLFLLLDCSMKAHPSTAGRDVTTTGSTAAHRGIHNETNDFTEYIRRPTHIDRVPIESHSICT